MNAEPSSLIKRTLLLILLAMFVTLGIMVLLTFMIPVQIRQAPPRLILVTLQVVAAVEILVGIFMERFRLPLAGTPGDVLLTAVVSVALGEAVGVYGVVYYFVSAERHWEFFLLSAVYLLRLLVHLPEYNAKLDALATNDRGAGL